VAVATVLLVLPALLPPATREDKTGRQQAPVDTRTLARPPAAVQQNAE
jgi:hypothetical protein